MRHKSSTAPGSSSTHLRPARGMRGRAICLVSKKRQPQPGDVWPTNQRKQGSRDQKKRGVRSGFRLQAHLARFQTFPPVGGQFPRLEANSKTTPWPSQFLTQSKRKPSSILGDSSPLQTSPISNKGPAWFWTHENHDSNKCQTKETWGYPDESLKGSSRVHVPFSNTRTVSST